ncbi:MAG: hypothetical protein Q9223_005314 [Gallowayella weberi]
MDVPGLAFNSALPSLVTVIADAAFVAIDFELSGIPPKSYKDQKAPRDRSSGKPSLQERYDEYKLAAEKYHILQMGITCVGENNYRGEYVLRPYNFNLKPGVDKGMNISRDSTYSNDAMDFLEEHGFDREAARKTGIHYLSRAEEARERCLNAESQVKASFTDVQPSANDTKSWELLKRLREEVNAWMTKKPPKPDHLNFAPIGHDKPPFPDQGLNNFQRFLVHQCIRKEYPELVTFKQAGFIQIAAYDKDREDARKEYRARVFEERLAKQVGLRWLVEAVHGGDLSKINPDSFIRGAGARELSVISEFTKLQKQLLGCSTVLVGHNVFMDLIYFYACFFGPLPTKVESFQLIINQLFPRIIDTKYLATYHDPYLHSSELSNLDERLSKNTEPKIGIQYIFQLIYSFSLIQQTVLHPSHPKYDSAKPFHEAGYDSYMTARVFLRLAIELETSAPHLDDPPSPINQASSSPPEMGVLIDHHDVSANLQAAAAAADDISSKSSSQPSSGSGSGSGSASTVPRPTFSHPTKFDLLGDLSCEEIETLALGVRAREPGLKPADVDLGRDAPRRLPAWESDFWKVFGNKLRVNGTVEEVCCLGGWPQ